MELLKGKEFISQKLNWLHKGGLKAIEKVTGEETTAGQNLNANVQNANQDQGDNQNINQDVTQPGTEEQPGVTTQPASEQKTEKTEQFDDELLWSKQYNYDEFIESLSQEYEERGSTDLEKRHWSYPRRWIVKLFNLKIVNLTAGPFSCFAEFDFGGSRNECRVQIGSTNYILNSGKSKNYIRTPVLKGVEKDSTGNFNCSHSFEYRGSYLDLENEKLRIKVWKCNSYTINTLESIYEELLIKFAEGDEHVDIAMYKYVKGQKNLTCKLSFNLFFQELYDFGINLMNFKIQNSISSYYLFNYQRLYLSKLTDQGEQNDKGGLEKKNGKEKVKGDVDDWNMINKMRYRVFKLKMERKMKKINANTNKVESEPEPEDEEEEDEDMEDEENEKTSESNVERKEDDVKEELNDKEAPIKEEPKKDKRRAKKEKKKKEKELKKISKNKKRKIGVGVVTKESKDNGENRETTLVFRSKNKEYISILRENTNLFVKIGTFIPLDCKLPPSPRLSIRLKTSSINLKKMGLMSNSVRNAFNCEWDNLGEINFRGTLSELSNSFLEIKLLDWSAPKAANCIGTTTIPLESIVDYPYVKSKLYAPEWLRLKSKYEGWEDKLEDLHLGTVSGSLVINRKPRYRQMRGCNTVYSSQQLLLISINNIDQLLVNTQERVDSFVEVNFNNVTVRTNICKDMLGPIYNEELYIPIQTDLNSTMSTNSILSYEELLQMGVIRITVWGYVMEKFQYFGSCEIGIREIFYNKNSLRQLTKKTHNLMDSSKYETTYETRVLTTTKKLYHYQYDPQDNPSNISLSIWFYPLVPIQNPNQNKGTQGGNISITKVGPNQLANKEGVVGEGKEEGGVSQTQVNQMTEEEKINKLFEIWRRICMVTNNEQFAEYCYLFDQFGNKMFPSSFVNQLHPPPSVDSINHIFHIVTCVTFINKNLQNAFTVDFLLKLKSGNVMDHCILMCSFLLNSTNNAYVAIGQQKDKKYNAFVLQINNNPGKVQNANQENEKEEEVNENSLIIYDFMINQIIKINLNNLAIGEDEEKNGGELEKEWIKKETKKLNFVTINLLFNNNNIWLNAQENKNIMFLDYDVNNINNWYPFIPYNPAKTPPTQYYTKVKNKINLVLEEGGTTNLARESWGGRNRDAESWERKYYIDWNRINDYVVETTEMRLLEEMNRYLGIYRSSQNLTTNYNKCPKLQQFLKKYLLLIHEETISNEENLKLIKSQINEWKEEMEKKIPRSYQALIRTVHFNTVDSGVMFDIIKHKLNFLDSRESTSIFATTVKIFQLSSHLYSTYFLVLYSSKIHEKIRKEILLHRYLINKKNLIKKHKKVAEEGEEDQEEEEEGQQMEIEQLLIDEEELVEEKKKLEAKEEDKKGKKEKKELADVVSKNLKLQTKNFNRLKTKQLNNITTVEGSKTFTSDLESLTGSSATSTFSSSSSLLDSEEEKEEQKWDNQELLNMPSYEIRRGSTEGLEKNATLTFSSSSSSILKSILTNSNLYSSSLESTFSNELTSKLQSIMLTSKLISSQFSRTSSKMTSRMGNTNLHSTLEFTEHSSSDFRGKSSSQLDSTSSFQNLESNLKSQTTIDPSMSGEVPKLDEKTKNEEVKQLNGVVDSLDSNLKSLSIVSGSGSGTLSSQRTESNRYSTSTFTVTDETSSRQEEIVNKKLMLNSKIVKNKNDKENIINNLDKFSKLTSLDLGNKEVRSKDVSGSEKEEGWFTKSGFLGNIFSNTTSSSSESKSSKTEVSEKENTQNQLEPENLIWSERESLLSSTSANTRIESTESGFSEEKDEFKIKEPSDYLPTPSLKSTARTFYSGSKSQESEINLETREYSGNLNSVSNSYRSKTSTGTKEENNIFTNTSSSYSSFSSSKDSKTTFNIFDEDDDVSSKRSNTRSESEGKSISKLRSSSWEETEEKQDATSTLSSTTSNEEEMVEEDYLDNLSIINKPTKSGSFRKEEIMRRNQEVMSSKILADKLFSSSISSKNRSSLTKSSSLGTSWSMTSESRDPGTERTTKSKEGSVLISSSEVGRSNLSRSLGSGSKEDTTNSNLDSRISMSIPGTSLSQTYQRESTNERSSRESFVSYLKSSDEKRSELTGSSLTSDSHSKMNSKDSYLNSSETKDFTSSSVSGSLKESDLSGKNDRAYRKINVYSSFAS